MPPEPKGGPGTSRREALNGPLTSSLLPPGAAGTVKSPCSYLGWEVSPGTLALLGRPEAFHVTHRLWSGTAEWPWLQEAVSTNLGACVCWSHGQTPRPGSGPQGSWGPARRPPPGGMWGETGLSPAYVILGKSLPSPDRGARGPNFPTELAGQGTLCCSEDPTTPGLHRAEAAQASRRHFRL